MKKILVSVDGSECSERAVQMALSLAKKYDSELVLLHAIDLNLSSILSLPMTGSLTGGISSPIVSDAGRQTLESSIEEIEVEKAKDLLENAKSICIALGDKVKAEYQFGNPADVIVKAAKKLGADLVVMGSSGMSGLRRFFVGSVTYKVALSVEQPILIVR